MKEKNLRKVSLLIVEKMGNLEKKYGSDPEFEEIRHLFNEFLKENGKRKETEVSKEFFEGEMVQLFMDSRYCDACGGFTIGSGCEHREYGMRHARIGDVGTIVSKKKVKTSGNKHEYVYTLKPHRGEELSAEESVLIPCKLPEKEFLFEVGDKVRIVRIEKGESDAYDLFEPYPDDDDWSEENDPYDVLKNVKEGDLGVIVARRNLNYDGKRYFVEVDGKKFVFKEGGLELASVPESESVINREDEMFIVFKDSWEAQQFNDREGWTEYMDDFYFQFDKHDELDVKDNRFCYPFYSEFANAYGYPEAAHHNKEDRPENGAVGRVLAIGIHFRRGEDSRFEYPLYIIMFEDQLFIMDERALQMHFAYKYSIGQEVSLISLCKDGSCSRDMGFSGTINKTEEFLNVGDTVKVVAREGINNVWKHVFYTIEKDGRYFCVEEKALKTKG